MASKFHALMTRSIVPRRQKVKEMTLESIPKMKSSIATSVAKYPGPFSLRLLAVVLPVDVRIRDGRQDAACSYLEGVEHHRAFLDQFEEWPLQDMLLKRITEGGRTTFQLQFEWATSPCQPCPNRPTTPTKKGKKRRPKNPLSTTTSSGSRWTSEEDEMVYRMKRDNCSWAEIQRAIPHRSQGSIQVRYSKSALANPKYQSATRLRPKR
ncbi:hypothetical protein FOVSG1_006172 [Fusarium oxysporum f. sp. vasinfectum]